MNLPGTGFWLYWAGASLAAAALAWALGLLLQRSLRLSAAAHGYWFGIWSLAVLPPLAALALSAALPAAALLPPALQPLQPLPLLDALPDWNTSENSDIFQSWNLSELVPLLLALAYLAGLLLRLWRLAAAHRSLQRLLQAGATALPEAALPGPHCRAVARQLRQRGIALLSCEAATSPFALNRPQPAVVLPQALLQRLDDRQLALVLRHEAAHLARRDPQRAALMQLSASVWWFNPLLPLLARRVQTAAELCCDASALREQGAARQAYARAYLETLRLTAPPALATAFIPADRGHHKLRIQHMLHGDPHPPLSRRLRHAVLLALASAGLVVTATQAVFAGTAAPVATAAADPQPAKAVMTDSSVVTLARAGGNPAPGSKAAATAHDDAATAPGHAVAATSQSEATRGRAAPALEFRAPLSTRKISSRYGASGGSRTRPHRGIDFAAARGTPVLAAAAGVVAAATTRYPEAAIYGTVVVIDHGQGWQTLYAHLADFSVAPGQRIDAGTPIGRVGMTGVSTGPHVHMEMFHNGERVDPEPLLR